MTNNLMSLVWLIFAVVIFVIAKFRNEQLSPMFYCALICSSVWAAA